MSLVEINNKKSPPKEVHLQRRCLERKKILNEQELKIIKLSENLTSIEISKEINIPYPNVYYYLKKNGKFKPNDKPSIFSCKDEMIIKNIEKGNTITKTAKELGFNKRSLSDYIRKEIKKENFPDTLKSNNKNNYLKLKCNDSLIQELYNKNIPSTKIAKTVDCSIFILNTYIKERHKEDNNVFPERKNYKSKLNKHQEYIIEQIKDGKSYKDIALELGCHLNTLYLYAKTHNIFET